MSAEERDPFDATDRVWDAEPTRVEDVRVQEFGRYRLCYELGKGGMATVYLARASGHAGFEKLVALKCIREEKTHDPRFVRMFLDEARIASRIQHPNVCSVFDFGESQGRYYIAMEYLLGESLAHVINALLQESGEQATAVLRRAALAASILADVCEGLHAAHELRTHEGRALSVVHRDISPHNLFLTYAGHVSVVDFGVASASGKFHHSMTGEVKGKLSYMAPEQLRQSKVDRRADVWSLGVVLWELLTLRRLFPRGTPGDTVLALANKLVVAPSTVARELPKSLDAIVLRALARDPDERYATARDFGRDLVGYLRQEAGAIGLVDRADWMQQLFPGRRDRQLALIDTATAIELPEQRAISSTTQRPSGSRRTLLAVALVGIGIGVGLLAGQVIGRNAPPVSVPEPDPVSVPEPDPVSVPEPDPASVPEPDPASVPEPDPEPAPSRGPGSVSVVTPGTWATVSENGRELGQSPVRLVLPSGRHVLHVREHSEGTPRRVEVIVRPGRTSIVSVAFD